MLNVLHGNGHRNEMELEMKVEQYPVKYFNAWS